MKLNFTIIFGLILLSAYSDISISHTNADNQTVLIELMAPTADTSNALKLKATITSEYLFTEM